MVVSTLHFAANLIIVGLIFRLIEAKWGESWLGKSLSVIY